VGANSEREEQARVPWYTPLDMGAQSVEVGRGSPQMALRQSHAHGLDAHVVCDRSAHTTVKVVSECWLRVAERYLIRFSREGANIVHNRKTSE